MVVRYQQLRMEPPKARKGQDQMDKPFTEEELSKVLANPFYCLRSVHPIFAQDHDTLVSEEQWVKASANLIREIGEEKFLRLLLENLKGHYCQ
jgi:hypothetical protein